MALVFSNSPGAIFNILGRCGKAIAAMRTYQATQRINLVDATVGLIAQLNAYADIQAVVGAGYLSQLSLPEGVASFVQGVAAQAVNRAVFLDNPRPNQNLTQLNVPASLKEIIRQMKVQGASVLRAGATISGGTFSAPSNGNGVAVASLTRPFDGALLENAYAENLLLTCNSDSFLGGATLGNEGFSLVGAGSQSDPFAFNWPLGSNCSLSLSAANGNANNSQGNLLTNSGFELFTTTPNIPDNWLLTTGVAGTHLFQETSVVFAGSSALRLKGDGSNLTSWQQPFGVTPGTLGTLSPLSQYAFNVYMRRDGVAAGAGLLQVDLVDGGGVIIKDAGGNNNSTTIDLTGTGPLTTVYGAQNVSFRTPEILPAQQSLRFHLINPLTAGRQVYFDTAALAGMSQCYTQGPFVALFSGASPFLQNDFCVIPCVNTRGGAGTLSSFQALWYLLFPDAANNELLLPSSATPTISDTLITS